jgi:exopolysaccharide production protein ExoY
MEFTMANVAPNFMETPNSLSYQPGDASRGTAAIPQSEKDCPLGGSPKRALDCLVAGALLLLAAPLMAVIAGLIIVLDGGHPMFSHIRIGYGGRAFACLKFRTMRRDADAILAAHLSKHPEAAREWSESRKLCEDPRVTRIGAFLRKTSLDELPQLLNILKGEMSLVGPRPVTRDELPRYEAHAEDYLRSRPGLTGLWQVTGRSGTDFATRVSFDHRYVSTWSFLSDLSILARTPAAVFRGEGAY